MVSTQSPQGTFDRAAYSFRARIRDDSMRAGCIRALEGNTEFCRKDNPVAERPEGTSQEFLVVVRVDGCTVRFGRVEKRVPHIHRIREQLCHFLPVSRSAVGMAHSHASQSYGGHLQSTVSQYPVIHVRAFCFCPAKLLCPQQRLFTRIAEGRAFISVLSVSLLGGEGASGSVQTVKM